MIACRIELACAAAIPGAGWESITVRRDQHDGVQFALPESAVEELVYGQLIQQALYAVGILVLVPNPFCSEEPLEVLEDKRGGVLACEVDVYAWDRDSADRAFGASAVVVSITAAVIWCGQSLSVWNGVSPIFSRCALPMLASLWILQAGVGSW